MKDQNTRTVHALVIPDDGDTNQYRVLTVDVDNNGRPADDDMLGAYDQDGQSDCAGWPPIPNFRLFPRWRIPGCAWSLWVSAVPAGD